MAAVNRRRTGRSRRSRRSPAGRALEIAANLVLLGIVLAFGISIAARYGSSARPVERMERMEQEVEPEPPIDPELLRDRPTVDIRNGCGESGLAERMMQRLRRAGFDVVEYRNADRYDYERTLIRDRSGREGAAARLQEWLVREYGVGSVEADPVAVPEADLQLVLGADLADTLAGRAARAARRGAASPGFRDR